jgi:hypothetical protein
MTSALDAKAVGRKNRVIISVVDPIQPVTESSMQSTPNRRKIFNARRAIIILLFVVVGSALFLWTWPPFGGTVSGERLERAQASRNYDDGEFVNSLPHPPLESGDVWGYIKEQFFGDQIRVPPSAIPIAPIQPSSLRTQSVEELRTIWLGHSSVYIDLAWPFKRLHRVGWSPPVD